MFKKFPSNMCHLGITSFLHILGLNSGNVNHSSSIFSLHVLGPNPNNVNHSSSIIPLDQEVCSISKSQSLKRDVIFRGHLEHGHVPKLICYLGITLSSIFSS